MSKLKNPLLSLKAQGALGAALTFLRRRKQDIVEKTPIPTDRKTFLQLEWRHMYQKAVALWHALSAEEKQEWESLARRKHMTGFAWFVSQALKPNPGLYLPLQGGTMTGDIEMGKHRILKLPIPTDNQEAASKKYHDDNLPPGGYTAGARVYHNISQSIPNATDTILAFNSEVYDTNTIHDPVTNNSRLTCKTAGKYLIIASVSFESNATGFRALLIWVNGATPIAVSDFNVSGAGRWMQAISTIYSLALNEYVEAGVYQTSGAALNLPRTGEPQPKFMMQRIG